MQSEPTYPRLRDLPVAEREPFCRWLMGKTPGSLGHTMPICDPTEPREQWDWYYPWDYAAWRAGDPGYDS